MTRYLLYLGRWQLSTPTLALTIAMLGPGLWQAIVANLIGGAIFYWVDRWIFRHAPVAQLEERPPCKRVVAGSSPAGGSING